MSICRFSEILKKLRKERNLTQKELGANLGLSKAVISKYENALGYPSFDSLIQFAGFFGVTTDYLLGVETKKVLDVSGLSESQTEIVRSIISEFKTHNK